MEAGLPVSFSAARKWSLSLSLLLALLASLALLAMINYLSARHFSRLPLSAAARTQLSPLTGRVLGLLTNELKVTVFFDKEDPLFDPVRVLLQEYAYKNPKISVDLVDQVRDATAANLVKARYKLAAGTDKNLVIFDCNGRSLIKHDNELSDVDINPLVSGQSSEVRRTHFRGEMVFTSAILSVSAFRPLKAYFLQGHGEHKPDSEEQLMGYAKFADLLKENNVQFGLLSLLGTGEVPFDCNLLIIAGPRETLLQDELEKIERYLKQGGRLFLLFNHLALNRPTGLERIMADWGVAVGQNVVVDPKNSDAAGNLVVTHISTHAIVKPLYRDALGLYLNWPRTVTKLAGTPPGADAPQVERLATTGPEGRVLTELREGVPYPRADDFVGTVPLMVAVEKGGLKSVATDRGTTRLVVVGESVFLGNELIDRLSNHDFASHAINWLLARNELLANLPPRPIKEYKLTVTDAQMTVVRWIFLAGMPGTVLLLGLLVWVRRRR